MSSRCQIALALAAVSLVSPAEGQAAAPRKIVLIAGVKSHGPEGNRIHDYSWTARLLKASLETSNVKDSVRVTYTWRAITPLVSNVMGTITTSGSATVTIN